MQWVNEPDYHFRWCDDTLIGAILADMICQARVEIVYVDDDDLVALADHAQENDHAECVIM